MDLIKLHTEQLLIYSWGLVAKTNKNYQKIIFLNGTVRVISCDSPCKDGNALEVKIWSKMWKILSFFLLEKYFFLIIYQMLLITKKCSSQCNFHREKNHEYLINTWSDKAFDGKVVNRALSSLHGGSLEITLTVL